MRSRRVTTTAVDSSRQPLAILEERFPGRPVYDTAVTHAMLRHVAEGVLPESMRLYVPDDVVVFSLLDARRPGFAAARAAAHAHGCGAVLRLAGGHAALFHTRCLAFSWAVADERARDGIRNRFRQLSSWVAGALNRLGVDARVGEVAGEYCPGEYSVNAGGRIKLMGVGQRVIRGAAHVGGVIVVEDAARVREVLGSVYRALDLDWQPSTAGAVADVAPGATPDSIRAAVLAELGATHRPEPARFDVATLARARELEAWHDPEADPARDGHRRLGAKTLVAGPGKD
jgi:octanoyl-[GcvH]:protein N-octanoyltransferase